MVVNVKTRLQEAVRRSEPERVSEDFTSADPYSSDMKDPKNRKGRALPSMCDYLFRSFRSDLLLQFIDTIVEVGPQAGG
jgi:hypothetical protein